MRRGHFHHAPLTMLGSSPWFRCETMGLLKCDSIWTSRLGKTQYLWGISSLQYVIACANALPDGTRLNRLKMWHCGKKDSVSEKQGLVRWNSAKWNGEIRIWIIEQKWSINLFVCLYIKLYMLHVFFMKLILLFSILNIILVNTLLNKHNYFLFWKKKNGPSLLNVIKSDSMYFYILLFYTFNLSKKKKEKYHNFDKVFSCRTVYYLCSAW